MAHLAIDDQAGGQLDEGQVVLRALLPADQQPAEAVEPTVRHLHHPAPRWVTGGIPRWGQRLRRTALGRDVRRIAARHRRLATLVVVVAAIQRQMRLRVRRVFAVRHLGRRRRRDQRGVEQVRQLLHVGAVGPGEHHRNGHPLALGQQVPLGAALAPVGGVGPRRLRLARPPFLPSGALTRHPSAACHCQSRPTSSSYRLNSSAQARAKQPWSTHSRKRAWTVDLAPNARGKASHWLPVRASQISPSKIGRSSLRGRPGFLRGLVITNNGCNSAHRASSTRQIVGSSLAVGGAGLGCVIETPPGAVKWPVLPLAYQTSDFLDSLLAERVANGVAWGAVGLQALTEDELADLFIWLVREYPPSEDPDIDGIHSVAPRESVARWRDSLVEHLKARGTERAIAAIQRLVRELPELPWLKWSLLTAQVIARRRTWIPSTP